MKLYPKNSVALADVKRFVAIFYIVGTLGFLIPTTRSLFVLITPIALLVGSYLLLLYHPHYTSKTILSFIIIALLGFFVEVLGVKTGLVFGNYAYGRALGVKLLDTPLLIGLNWLFLSYSCYSIVWKLKINGWIRLFTAPLLMLTYDIFLEQVAPKTEMWYWENASPSIRNYVAWYIVGFVFTALLLVCKVDTSNKLAKLLFFSQLLFFAILTFFI